MYLKACVAYGLKEQDLFQVSSASGIFFSGGCEDNGHFSRFFCSKLSIYLQNYVKNGLIFKTANQADAVQIWGNKRSTLYLVHYILTLDQLSVVAGEPAAFVYLVDLADDDDINNSLGTYYSDAQTPKRNRNNHIQLSKKHRLRHIDTHLAYVCTMPYTYSGKNSYAEPVLNKTKQISKSGINMSTFLNKRKRYVSKMTLHATGIALCLNLWYGYWKEDFHWLFIDMFKIIIDPSDLSLQSDR